MRQREHNYASGSEEIGGERSLTGETARGAVPLSRSEVQACARRLFRQCSGHGARRLSVTQISREYGVSQTDALRIFAQALCMDGRDIIFVDDGDYRLPTSRSASRSSLPRGVLSRGELEFLLRSCRDERSCGA